MIIANPIYDVVFKFLLEDERVTKILLSALLDREVTKIQKNRNEYTDTQISGITVYRIDFSANVIEPDGSEHQVLIELQKTWVHTEVSRFRKYLSMQYGSNEHIYKGADGREYALPIISIYILGHKLGGLDVPVLYINRKYLASGNVEIADYSPHPFIESLSHDCIFVQLPCLDPTLQDRLSRLLVMFDQRLQSKGNPNFLELDEDGMNEDERLIFRRLEKAAVSKEVRKKMEIEDEVVAMINSLEESKKTIEEKDKKIEEMEMQKRNNARAMKADGMPIDIISKYTGYSTEEIEQLD